MKVTGCGVELDQTVKSLNRNEWSMFYVQYELR